MKNNTSGGRPVVLLVGGTDPSGGAGLAADLKAVAAMGGHGCLAVTAVTVQHSGEVRSWKPVAPEEVAAQMVAVADDGGGHAVKSGMLGSAETAQTVAKVLEDRFLETPYVLDPVMVAGSGDALSAEGMVEAVRRELVPRAVLCTPNLDEAEKLVGFSVRTPDEMKRAGKALCDLGAGAALVKGGHLEGEPTDVLVVSSHIEGESPKVIEFPGRRLVSGKVHGTGCTLGAATATLMGAGFEPQEAVRGSLTYLKGAIRASFPRRHGVLLGHFPGMGDSPAARRMEGGGDGEAYYGTSRFCSRCGGELRALPQFAPHRVCVDCGFVAYRNPLPVVAIVVRKEGRLCVVRRARAPKKGELCLPGGFLEVGESLEDCAQRELYEETRMVASDLQLIGVETDETPYGSMTFTFFEAESVSGEPRAGDDASEVLWEDLEKLPLLAFSSHNRVIKRFVSN